MPSAPSRAPLLCLLATTLSSVVIFLIVKRYGMKFVTLFVSEEKLHSLKFLQDTRRLELLTFLLFFIPGTPQGRAHLRGGPHPHEAPGVGAHHRRGPHPLGSHLHRRGQRPGLPGLPPGRHRLCGDGPLSAAWGVLLYRAIQKRHSRQSAPPPEDPLCIRLAYSAYPRPAPPPRREYPPARAHSSEKRYRNRKGFPLPVFFFSQTMNIYTLPPCNFPQMVYHSPSNNGKPRLSSQIAGKEGNLSWQARSKK